MRNAILDIMKILIAHDDDCIARHRSLPTYRAANRSKQRTATSGSKDYIFPMSDSVRTAEIASRSLILLPDMKWTIGTKIGAGYAMALIAPRVSIGAVIRQRKALRLPIWLITHMR